MGPTSAVGSGDSVRPPEAVVSQSARDRLSIARLIDTRYLIEDRSRVSYSITVLARSRISEGKVMPSAFAVFMLIASSNSVGC